MGRYRVEVTGPGNIRREQEITIRPGAQERLLVALRAVAVAPQTGVQPKKSNKKIWLLAGIGGVGAAAALALGGGGGGGTQQPPPSTSGSITVQVPVNP
jgi:hypothetical protein